LSRTIGDGEPPRSGIIKRLGSGLEFAAVVPPAGRVVAMSPDGADIGDLPLRSEPIAPAFPIVIASWRRNSREIVRVALDRFNNRETIDIRSWWQDSGGNWRPGRGGLTLAVKHLPALADGLAMALDRARARGLIEPTGNTNTKDITAAERQRRHRQRVRNAATT
jgi:hypothetical protein